jgi:hypothetical protein
MFSSGLLLMVHAPPFFVLVKYMFDMMKADYTAAIHLEYCIKVIIYGRMWE